MKLRASRPPAPRPDRRRLAGLLLASAGLALGPPAGVRSQTGVQQKFPDIVSVKVVPRGGNVFDFDVTVSSPYDTAARYADAFRVSAKGGAVLGERILLHDHADEQPFTRDLYGVAIPPGVAIVVIEGRDRKHGWGGKIVEIRLPGR